MKSQRVTIRNKEQEESNPQLRARAVSSIMPNLSDYLKQNFPNLQAFISNFSQKKQDPANFATNERQRQEQQQDPISEMQIIAGQCQICLNQILKQQDVFSLSQKCNHTFCQPCLNSYLSSRFAGLLPIVCPHDGCAQAYSKDSQYFKKLKPEFQKQCRKVQLALQISKDPSKKLCPSQICSFGVVTIQKSEKTAKCDKCLTEFCIKCMMQKHKGNCDKAQVNYLQDQLKFKKCRKCKMIVERSQGCNHMTCRCAYEFCYICGRTFTLNHQCQHCLDFLQDAPEPIILVLQVIFMLLLFLVLTAIITLIFAISLVLGAIGGSTIGPFALIYKLLKVNKRTLATLTIIFYPITVIITLVLACGFLFITISQKLVYYRARNIFYTIKQL